MSILILDGMKNGFSATRVRDPVSLKAANYNYI